MSRQSTRPQRGAAVVTALLLTALTLTVVAGLFWQQQVQVRSIERQRMMMQQRWLLSGALDWTRLVLREDGLNSSLDHLGEAWARPLPPTQMDQFLPSAAYGGDWADATLSGAIADAQARFDINALASRGVPDATQVRAFARLLDQLRLDPGLAAAVADHVARRQRLSGVPGVSGLPGEGAAVPMEQAQDLLAVAGLSPMALEAMRGHLAFLPKRSPLNLNTAAAEVLAASLPPQAGAVLRAILEARRVAPFRDIEDFMHRVPASGITPQAGRFGVSSNFFLVRGSLSARGTTTSLEGLVERAGGSTRLWWVIES